MFTLPIVERYIKLEKKFRDAQAVLIATFAPEVFRQRSTGRNDAEIEAYLQSLSIPEEIVCQLVELRQAP
jgi:hypothetical protein